MKMGDSQTRIIIAGFGGQGIVLAGTVIAKACLIENKCVTQMVSYGAEIRGGTANATVVISSEEISSPVFERPDIAVILNQPSLDKYEKLIVDGGLAIINSSLVTRETDRKDLDVVRIDATEIARQLGNIRVANIIALGALAKKTSLLKMESMTQAIEELFSAKKAGLIEINKKALQRGAMDCQPVLVD